MNVAVINIKDIFKYILKLGVILILIYICMQAVKGAKDLKKDNIKDNLESSANKISKNSYVQVLDISMPLLSYKKNNKSKGRILSNKDILSMGSGIFDESIFENTDLVIDKKELTSDDVEEVQKQIEELPKDATTENVEENNIIPKFTTSYKGIKINNQSDYELTEEILEPNVEITNKKDILIYHTHTCESYTPSERI